MVLLDLMDLRGHQDLLVNLVSQVNQVLLETMDLLAMPGNQVRQELKGPQDNLDHQG